ncbi:MAG: SDR family oxidoreductase [Gordonia sp. (in: high G+C Gram-positive bacteria)]|uniref:SDR family oxidoreductase n=1 Tax=Gordonia sp. (in: high G+C Gram-positive bacteria) TaxID=84139 RepID=UPI0039E3F518
MSSTLHGKVVLITGGANGVGAQTARELRARGALLVLTDIDRTTLEATVAELGPEHTEGIVADVTDLTSMEAAVAQAVTRFGGVDAVVANAGIASYGSVLNTEPEAFYRLIDINVNGVFNTVRAALPALVERRGYVLVVSSVGAFVGAPSLASYTCSKAGVENFATSLRLEVAHLGVDVGSAHMSWIDTPMVRDAQSDLPAFREMLKSLPGPMSTVTTIDECGVAFAEGIAKRRRRVYCPEWVGVMRYLKPFLDNPISDLVMGKRSTAAIIAIDQQIASLGRSVSARFTEEAKAEEAKAEVGGPRSSDDR